jgi:hypothetical protein
MSTAPYFHKQHVKIVANVTTTENTDILESDFQKVYDDSIIRVTAWGAAMNLRLVPNSGEGVTLFGGGTLSGNLRYEEFNLDSGRTWNVQTSTSGGLVLRFLLIEEVRL